jgi:hypothetical protein
MNKKEIDTKLYNYLNTLKKDELIEMMMECITEKERRYLVNELKRLKL